MSSVKETSVGAGYVRSIPSRMHMIFPKRPDLASSNNQHSQNIRNATIKMYKDREEDSGERVLKGIISIEEFGWEMTETDSERSRYLSENQPIIVFSSTEASTSSK